MIYPDPYQAKVDAIFADLYEMIINSNVIADIIDE